MQPISSSYADSVRLRSLQNPCLGGLLMHMRHAPKVDSMIRLLEYDDHGIMHSGLPQFAQRELPRLFEGPKQAVGRVLLIENLRPDVISCLGEHLDVDPMFFADYITTEYQGVDKAPPPPSLAFCPSQVLERGQFHIHYQQVIDLGKASCFQSSEYILRTKHNVPRNIRRLPHLSGRQLALSRACCSILVKRRGNTWYSKYLQSSAQCCYHR